MIRNVAFAVGGIAWFLFMVLVGVYVTFPDEAVRERLEYEVDEGSNHEYALGMASLSPWWRLGVTLHDATLYTVKKGRRTKENPKPPYERHVLLELDSLGVRVSPLAVLTGKQGFAWAADVYGGDVDGHYAATENAVDLAFQIADVDLSLLEMDGPDQTLNLLGTLEADADLHFDAEDVKQSSGTLRLAIPGLAIAAGTKMGGFGLPEATFTKAVIALEIEDGKMKVTEGVLEGPVMSAEITGDVTLNKRLSRSRNRLDVAFTLPEEFDQLAQLSPTLRRSKDDDGRYHCQMSGTVLAPTFRCGKPTLSRIRSAGDDEEPGAEPGLPSSRIRPAGGVDDGQTDEERRAAREERIRERRERLKARREAALRGEDDGGPDIAEPRVREPLDPMDLQDGPPKGPPGVDLPPLDDFEPPPPPPGGFELPPDEFGQPEDEEPYPPE